MEDDGKALNGFFKQRRNRLGRGVATGQACAAGGDDDIDFRIVYPALHAGANGRGVIALNGAINQIMACVLRALGQNITGGIIGFSARVGDGQHRNIDRHEGQAFINSVAHFVSHLSLSS